MPLSWKTKFIYGACFLVIWATCFDAVNQIKKYMTDPALTAKNCFPDMSSILDNYLIANAMLCGLIVINGILFCNWICSFWIWIILSGFDCLFLPTFFGSYLALAYNCGGFGEDFYGTGDNSLINNGTDVNLS